MSDDPALADLERRRNLVASELARLSAALDEALGTAEAIHVDELRAPAPPTSPPPTPPPPDAAVTERLPRLDAALGAPWEAMLAAPAPRQWEPAPRPREPAPRPREPAPRPRGGVTVRQAPPEPAQVPVATGAPRGRRPLVLAALGVVAVALLAAAPAVQRSRGAEPAQATADAAVPTVSEAPLVVAPPSPAPAPSPPAPAPSPLGSPAPTSSRALDRVLEAAATAPVALPDATQALVVRVPALQRLSGEARAEEAADLYGLAVIAARGEATPGPATALVEALEPEVTFAALDLLARRRPDAVGSGVAPLLPGFAALPATPAGFQQVAAQELLDEMMEGVLGGTISPGFCNVGAHVLAPYLPDV